MSVAGDSITNFQQTPLFSLLGQKIVEDPFRLISAIIFLCAIIHTFLCSKFSTKARQLEQANCDSYKVSSFHWLGEVEVIFGLWLIPLLVSLICFKGWDATVQYFTTRHYSEPIFVCVIMMIAATRPILYVAERFIRLAVNSLGGERPSTWWFCILTIAPLFGSLITEPAAMTIAALLLSHKVFVYKPNVWFSYATLGLLFVNVSIGGTLTHFAAPPILMVANTWHWTTSYVFSHFGVKTIISVITSNLLYFLLFAPHLHTLNKRAKIEPLSSQNEQTLPLGIILTHVVFLAWTVLNTHHTVFVVFGGLLFLMVVQIFKTYQSPIALKESLLVGCFLAGLITHGGLQEWWIEAIVSRLNDVYLFYGSVILTSFNDNASLTYLASLVPAFGNHFQLQSAVVSGAVIGGGLTIIANAPNPAGQSILSKFFAHHTIKPVPLCIGALIPTATAIYIFRYLLA